jgi:hypothetical protein
MPANYSDHESEEPPISALNIGQAIATAGGIHLKNNKMVKIDFPKRKPIEIANVGRNAPALLDPAKNSSNTTVNDLGYISLYNLTETCVSLTYFFIAFL